MRHGLLTAGLILSVLFVIINAGYACPPQPPTAIIMALPEYVITGRTVTLDGSDSYPNPGIVEYRWDFDGDDSYDYTETITQYPDGAFDGITTHAYTQAGDYTVKLLVIKPGNLTDIDTCTVHVCEDSDNDDLPDCWETLYGLDPDDANDADEDDDSDGYNNLCEYLHLSEPNNTDSTPDLNYIITIDVPANVNSIQRAIDACIDGDTVVVAPGRYVENLCFRDEKITLTAIDPNDPAVVAKTIIDGDDCNNVIIFDPCDANSTITGFTITNGWAYISVGASYSNGGGIYCNRVSPTISNCVIMGNQAYYSGGGCYFYSPSPAPVITPTITGCIFQDNTATCYNGGGILNYRSNAKITDCIFANNKAGQYGGGVGNSYGSSPTLVNCVFTSNSVPGNYAYGGGMSNDNTNVNPTVVNCTFTANSAYGGGGIYNAWGAAPVLTNCILWNNTASLGSQIYDGSPVVTYCCVEGGWTGEGNIGDDPCFVDPCDPDGPDALYGTYDDGLMLAVGDSPCIDAGDNNAVSGVPSDIVGHARITDGDHNDTVIVDMGPYEVPTIWFVDIDDTGGDDGTSWEYAYNQLRDALANSDINDGNEIWVADGTYKPTSGTDRTISFELIEGVRVYGGFDGNEVGLCQREWNKYPTILSGDINQPDDANDNSYHVVVGADNAVLDGFTITAGNADGTDSNSYGGGIYYYNTSPVIITNCIIAANNAVEFGGGIHSRQYLYPLDSELKVTNCVFADNSSSENSGGAVATWQDNTSAAFTNCLFSNNHAAGFGAGIFFGAGVNNSAQLTNCTFYANDANSALVGGAIVSLECELTLANSIFWANTPDQVLAAYGMTQQSTFSHCDIQDSNGSGENWDFSLGIDAGGNIDADPNFADPCDGDGADNIWATADDGLMLNSNSPCRDTGDWDAAPPVDILGYLRRRADMGSYEYPLRIVVMCWINESSPYGSSTYDNDLEDYHDLITTLHTVKSGCYVPPDPIYAEDPGDPAKVLPEGYPAPEEVTMDDFPGRYDAVLSDFTSRFNDLVQGGIVPDYLVLIVDNSGSMYTSDIEPHYSQATEDNFIYWIQTNYPNTVIKRRDDRYENPFTNEQWLEAMRLLIESMLNEL